MRKCLLFSNICQPSLNLTFDSFCFLFANEILSNNILNHLKQETFQPPLTLLQLRYSAPGVQFLEYLILLSKYNKTCLNSIDKPPSAKLHAIIALIHCVENL